MSNVMEENWINLDDAAAYLGVRPVTLRDWIKKQESNGIPAFKIGNQWKFKKTELDEWVKTGKSAIRGE